MRAYHSPSDFPVTCFALPTASIIPQTTETSATADYLVVDATNTRLENGAFFIVRYGLGTDRPSLCLVEAIQRDMRTGPRWCLRSPGRFFADGPFSDPDSCEYLLSRIVGRLIGYVSPNGYHDVHDNEGGGLDLAMPKLSLLPPLPSPFDPSEFQVVAL